MADCKNGFLFTSADGRYFYFMRSLVIYRPYGSHWSQFCRNAAFFITLSRLMCSNTYDCFYEFLCCSSSILCFRISYFSHGFHLRSFLQSRNLCKKGPSRSSLLCWSTVPCELRVKLCRNVVLFRWYYIIFSHHSTPDLLLWSSIVLLKQIRVVWWATEFTQKKSTYYTYKVYKALSYLSEMWSANETVDKGCSLTHTFIPSLIEWKSRQVYG